MPSPAPSISITSARGELVCKYRHAAFLADCELIRVQDVLDQQVSKFSAQVVEMDSFWVRQSLELVLYLGRAHWRWPVTLHLSAVVGQRITGVALGDPTITRML